MAKMPAHQQQPCQLDDEQWGQQHQWWQQCHCNKGNNASLRMVTMPLQQGQQSHCGSRATMPLLQGQQCQLGNSKDTYKSTIATTPLSWGRQLQLQQRQRHLRIDGNYAITTRAPTPAQWQATRGATLVWQRRRCLHINNGDDAIKTRATLAIATTAKMPAHWQQQHHHNEGNNTSLTMSNKGDNACVRTHTNEHIIWSCSHAPLWTYHMFELASQLTNLANVSTRQISPSPCPPPCFKTFVCRNQSQLFVLRQESSNNSYIGATIMSCWYLYVLNFLAGLAF